MSKKETEQNPRELFDAKIQRIEEVLSHEPEFSRTYGNKGKAMILKALEVLKLQMSAALQLETVEESSKLADDKKTEAVEKALKYMLDVAIYKPVTKMVNCLSTEMAELANNWNKQVSQRPNIEQTTLVLERIVSTHLTLNDTIQITKKVLDRLQTELGRRPVAYELSEAYLNSTDFSVKRRKERKKSIAKEKDSKQKNPERKRKQEVKSSES